MDISLSSLPGTESHSDHNSATHDFLHIKSYPTNDKVYAILSLVEIYPSAYHFYIISEAPRKETKSEAGALYNGKFSL